MSVTLPSLPTILGPESATKNVPNRPETVPRCVIQPSPPQTLRKGGKAPSPCESGPPPATNSSHTPVLHRRSSRSDSPDRLTIPPDSGGAAKVSSGLNSGPIRSSKGFENQTVYGSSEGRRKM